MRHHAHGFWISDAPPAEPREPLSGNRVADFAIAGGGYTGMWAAWWIKQQAPGAEVVLLESDVCGHGPSGRNGGFCNSMWFSLPTLVRRFGEQRALAVCRAAEASVDAIGEWCRDQEVDARFRRGGYMQVSTCAAQDGTWRPVLEETERLGVGDVVVELGPEGVAARCRSPRLRGGAYFPSGANLDPARLAAGLRSRLIDAGVVVAERTPMRRFREHDGAIVVEHAGGELRAGRLVLATGGHLLRVGGLRHSLTGTSSHMVVTEPVPDLLEEIGWTGGESISDSRAMLHYFRTTVDGRIAFGWGGGRIVYGARLGQRVDVDASMAPQVEAHLKSFFPGLEGRRVEQAWGGPIDVSPTHLPMIRTLGSRVVAGFGYTGNGVGPSQMLGRALASLTLDRRDEHTELALVDPPRALVPPEPFRWAGGSLIRRAILRKERLEEEERSVDALTRAVCGIPERIGIHVGR
ncbi:MAG TPA: FAD-dependent oxidoreductase [Solirubrobacterales bacterium]|nr:FAD-dependent oxidoreductase [Solirubrobacterales bacterium]